MISKLANATGIWSDFWSPSRLHSDTATNPGKQPVAAQVSAHSRTVAAVTSSMEEEELDVSRSPQQLSYAPYASVVCLCRLFAHATPLLGNKFVFAVPHVA